MRVNSAPRSSRSSIRRQIVRLDRSYAVIDHRYMPTILQSDTQAISIQAPPELVLDLIAEPRNLPRWAPDFARAVRPEGELWIVDTGEGEVRRRIRVAREL